MCSGFSVFLYAAGKYCEKNTIAGIFHRITIFTKSNARVAVRVNWYIYFKMIRYGGIQICSFLINLKPGFMPIIEERSLN
jgi:hypothetical protein